MLTVTRPRPLALIALIPLLLLLGFGGIYGGLSLISDPTGAVMGFTADDLARLPLVANFLLPGIFLLLVMGIFPLLAAYALAAHPKWSFAAAFNPIRHEYFGWVWTLLTGVLVIGWMLFQLATLGYSIPLQTVILVLGVLITLLALLPGVREYFHEK